MSIKMADGSDYPPLTFYVDAPTAATYSSFLGNLRKNLTKSTIDKYNLPILASESEAQVKRYCFVDISYNSKPVTLGFDVVNLNLVAFKFATKSYFFSNTKDIEIFVGTEKVVMPFSNTYASLGPRGAVNLGMSALQTAVSALSSYSQHDTSFIKTSLINVIGMVLEAARFKLIQDDVTSDFDKDIPTNIVITSYEDVWGQLSENIQHAYDDGDFRSPVSVKNPDGTTHSITTVGDVKAKMGILEYYPPPTAGN